MSNFGLHDWDQVTYLVDTQVLDMGIFLLFLTRFRLLVGARGILVDLYPGEKVGLWFVGWMEVRLES